MKKVFAIVWDNGLSYEDHETINLMVVNSRKVAEAVVDRFQNGKTTLISTCVGTKVAEYIKDFGGEFLIVSVSFMDL